MNPTPAADALDVAAGLTPTSAGCTNSPTSGLACTLDFALVAGTYTATFSIFDGPLSGAPCSGTPASCSITGTGDVLSTYANLPVTIVAGQPNAINVSLGGIPASLALVALPGANNPIAPSGATTFSLTSCSATSAQVEVLALDAKSNVIVGPGAPAVALKETDAKNVLNLAAPSAASPNVFAFTPALLLAPNVPMHLEASAQSQTNASPAIAPLTLDTVLTYTGSAFCYPVTSFTDIAAAASTPIDPQTGNPIPGTGSGVVGDLRFGLFEAATVAPPPAELDVIFPGCSSAVPCTVTLNGPLPPIDGNVDVDGGAFGDVIIDGAKKYRTFFADAGSIALRNLQIQNAAATGGYGGLGAGGGAGFGAGLFVNAATVAVTNDYFLSCTVTGGDGGDGGSGTAPGGGGGMGGNGGRSDGGGGGGGGLLGNGAGAVPPPNNPAVPGGNGGLGGGGAGGGQGSGSGGAGYGDNPAGLVAANPTFGGAGSLGGGGGGAGTDNTGDGGAGGFGGGGGVGFGGASGTGGYGGGGGGGYPTSGSAAGAAGGVGGGTGGDGAVRFPSNALYAGGGGGGAAFGPAIFVNTGGVTITNSGASQVKATPGSGGVDYGVAGSPGTPGMANATPVYSTSGGTVNGALGSNPPS